jgi:hypothetical protein
MGGAAVLAISSIGRKLFEKLRRKSYRQVYMAEHVRRSIAYQIRALRDQRGWNQGAFSKVLDKPQSVVCRLEDPSYGKVTVQTLLEVANVCDVALQVRFVTYSVFLQQTRDTSTQSMRVQGFEDEMNESTNNRPWGSASAVAAFLNIQEQAVPAHFDEADDPSSALRPRLGSMVKQDDWTALLYSAPKQRVWLNA